MEDTTLLISASNCPIPITGKDEEDRAEDLSLSEEQDAAGGMEKSL